jgi:hypothetical protein
VKPKPSSQTADTGRRSRRRIRITKEDKIQEGAAKQ